MCMDAYVCLTRVCIVLITFVPCMYAGVFMCETDRQRDTQHRYTHTDKQIRKHRDIHTEDKRTDRRSIHFCSFITIVANFVLGTHRLYSEFESRHDGQAHISDHQRIQVPAFFFQDYGHADK
jgi:hypothetical protein